MRIAATAALLLAVASTALAQETTPPVHEGRTAAEWLGELREGDVAARRKAIYALWKMGPTAVPSGAEGLRPVVEALTDEEDYVADVAGRVLRRAGMSTYVVADRIGDALVDPRPIVRRHAIAVLAGLSNMARDAAPQVVEAMRSDEDEAVRAQAAWVLGACGWDLAPVAFGDQVVAALRDSLSDPAASVRANSALALAAYGEKAAAALPELQRVAREDPDEGPKARALDALANLGAAARGAAPTAVAALRDSSPMVRASAIGALYAIDPTHADLDAALLAELSYPHDAELRVRAVGLVGARKSLAPGFDEALRTRLSDSDVRVREAAAAAFAEKTPPTAATIDALAATLRDPAPGVRFRAAQALASYDAAAARAVPMLVEGLSSRDFLERSMAIIALGRIGRAAAEAVPSLRRLLAASVSGNPGLRSSVAQSLWRISAEARPEARAAVLRLLEDPTAWFFALSALEDMGPEVPEAVPGLVRWLKDGEPRFRARTARTLGAMGRAAESAIPDLEAAGAGGDATVRTEVEAALRRIRGPSAAAGDGK